jgi:hypothetical protein
MKKLFLITIMLSLLLFGCGKEEESYNTKGIKIDEVGIVKSDLGEECLLLKATNTNKTQVTIFSTLSLLNSSNKEVGEETGFINLYSNQSSYYIVEISSAYDYSSYKLKNESMINMYNNYKDIYDSIKVEQITSDDKETIKFRVNNNSTKEINAQVLGLFYKNNEIIAASIGVCENVSSKGKCEDTVFIPVNNVDDYTIIDYDKVELSLMNVDYK